MITCELATSPTVSRSLPPFARRSRVSFSLARLSASAARTMTICLLRSASSCSRKETPSVLIRLCSLRYASTAASAFCTSSRSSWIRSPSHMEARPVASVFASTWFCT